MTHYNSFWESELKHDLRYQSEVLLDNVKSVFTTLGLKMDDTNTFFLTNDYQIEFDFRSDDCFYVTINGIEYYFDNSTNEMIFENLTKNEIIEMCKDLGLTYKKIALITGLKHSSIKNQMQPNKPVQSWMKLVLYVYKNKNQ